MVLSCPGSHRFFESPDQIEHCSVGLGFTCCIGCWKSNLQSISDYLIWQSPSHVSVEDGTSMSECGYGCQRQAGRRPLTGSSERWYKRLLHRVLYLTHSEGHKFPCLFGIANSLLSKSFDPCMNLCRIYSRSMDHSVSFAVNRDF